MNKYKVTKLALGYKEKYPCVICNKKIKGKKITFIYAIDREEENGWIAPARANKTMACSEICADTYVLQHMDDIDPFYLMMKEVYPNLIMTDMALKDIIKKL